VDFDKPLTGTLRTYLDEERIRTDRAPASAQGDVRASLERELGIRLDDGVGPPRRLAPPRGALRAAHLAAASAFAFAAGVGVGVAVSRSPTPARVDQAVGSAPVAPKVETPERTAVPPPSAAIPPDTVTPRDPLPPAPSGATRPAPTLLLPAPSFSAPLGEGTESRERTLLDRARTAMARGDLPAAARALGEHESAYPHGVLAEERELLRIQEALRSGRRDDGVALARAFRAQHPASVLTPAVDRLLAAPSP